jgi:hypothetical protein
LDPTGPGDVKQDAVADLYDYQKARVTPLDWPACKWPSIPELVEAQQAALDGKDAPGVDLEQVPDNLRKYAKDDIAPRTQPVINGRATTKDNNGLIRVDNRIWVPAQRPYILSSASRHTQERRAIAAETRRMPTSSRGSTGGANATGSRASSRAVCWRRDFFLLLSSRRAASRLARE